MKTDMVKDKHFKLDQNKIDSAKKILGVKTETEAIDTALEVVIKSYDLKKERLHLVDRILKRREGLKKTHDDTAEWIREGRKERDRLYGA